MLIYVIYISMHIINKYFYFIFALQTNNLSTMEATYHCSATQSDKNY